MIREALAHLRGRLMRSVLTVAGIGIGILTLVVVGSLAERLHEIVVRSTALNSTSIFAVVQRSVLVRGDTAAVRAAGTALTRLHGVAKVLPEVVLPYQPGSDSGRFGPPALIFGLPDAAQTLQAAGIRVESGRMLRAGDARVAVVGPDFAASPAVHPGDVIAVYGSSYVVAGVLEKSFTIFDNAVIVPFADAQSLLAQSVPPSVAALPRNGVTAFLVVPQAGVDPRVLVGRINMLGPLTARDPAEFAATLQSTVRIFDAIVFGAALIALLVAAFSIVNTMTIAVTERTHEIGIRKAIGATDGDVLAEFLIEAAVIGALGGIVGIAAGALVVTYVDAQSAAGGNLELFAFSGRVAAGAFAFAVLLSALAGLVPAIAAARLDPAEALRQG